MSDIVGAARIVITPDTDAFEQAIQSGVERGLEQSRETLRRFDREVESLNKDLKSTGKIIRNEINFTPQVNQVQRLGREIRGFNREIRDLAVSVKGELSRNVRLLGVDIDGVIGSVRQLSASLREAVDLSERLRGADLKLGGDIAEIKELRTEIQGFRTDLGKLEFPERFILQIRDARIEATGLRDALNGIAGENAPNLATFVSQLQAAAAVSTSLASGLKDAVGQAKTLVTSVEELQSALTALPKSVNISASIGAPLGGVSSLLSGATGQASQFGGGLLAAAAGASLLRKQTEDVVGDQSSLVRLQEELNRLRREGGEGDGLSGGAGGPERPPGDDPDLGQALKRPSVALRELEADIIAFPTKTKEAFDEVGKQGQVAFERPSIALRALLDQVEALPAATGVAFNAIEARADRLVSRIDSISNALVTAGAAGRSGGGGGGAIDGGDELVSSESISNLKIEEVGRLRVQLRGLQQDLFGVVDAEGAVTSEPLFEVSTEDVLVFTRRIEGLEGRLGRLSDASSDIELPDFNVLLGDISGEVDKIGTDIFAKFEDLDKVETGIGGVTKGTKSLAEANRRLAIEEARLEAAGDGLNSTLGKTDGVLRDINSIMEEESVNPAFQFFNDLLKEASNRVLTFIRQGKMMVGVLKEIDQQLQQQQKIDELLAQGVDPDAVAGVLDALKTGAITFGSPLSQAIKEIEQEIEDTGKTLIENLTPDEVIEFFGLLRSVSEELFLVLRDEAADPDQFIPTQDLKNAIDDLSNIVIIIQKAGRGLDDIQDSGNDGVFLTETLINLRKARDLFDALGATAGRRLREIAIKIEPLNEELEGIFDFDVQGILLEILEGGGDAQGIANAFIEPFEEIIDKIKVARIEFDSLGEEFDDLGRSGDAVDEFLDNLENLIDDLDPEELANEIQALIELRERLDAISGSVESIQELGDVLSAQEALDQLEELHIVAEEISREANDFAGGFSIDSGSSIQGIREVGQAIEEEADGIASAAQEITDGLSTIEFSLGDGGLSKVTLNAADNIAELDAEISAIGAALLDVEKIKPDTELLPSRVFGEKNFFEVPVDEVAEGFRVVFDAIDQTQGRVDKLGEGDGIDSLNEDLERTRQRANAVFTGLPTDFQTVFTSERERLAELTAEFDRLASQGIEPLIPLLRQIQTEFNTLDLGPFRKGFSDLVGEVNEAIRRELLPPSLKENLSVSFQGLVETVLNGLGEISDTINESTGRFGDPIVNEFALTARTIQQITRDLSSLLISGGTPFEVLAASIEVLLELIKQLEVEIENLPKSFKGLEEVAKLRLGERFAGSVVDIAETLEKIRTATSFLSSFIETAREAETVKVPFDGQEFPLLELDLMRSFILDLSGKIGELAEASARAGDIDKKLDFTRIIEPLRTAVAGIDLLTAKLSEPAPNAVELAATLARLGQSVRAIFTALEGGEKGILTPILSQLVELEQALMGTGNQITDLTSNLSLLADSLSGALDEIKAKLVDAIGGPAAETQARIAALGVEAREVLASLQSLDVAGFSPATLGTFSEARVRLTEIRAELDLVGRSFNLAGGGSQGAPIDALIAQINQVGAVLGEGEKFFQLTGRAANQTFENVSSRVVKARSAIVDFNAELLEARRRLSAGLTIDTSEFESKLANIDRLLDGFSASANFDISLGKLGSAGEEASTPTDIRSAVVGAEALPVLKKAVAEVREEFVRLKNEVGATKTAAALDDIAVANDRRAAAQRKLAEAQEGTAGTEKRLFTLGEEAEQILFRRVDAERRLTETESADVAVTDRLFVAKKRLHEQEQDLIEVQRRNTSTSESAADALARVRRELGLGAPELAGYAQAASRVAEELGGNSVDDEADSARESLEGLDDEVARGESILSDYASEANLMARAIAQEQAPFDEARDAASQLRNELEGGVPADFSDRFEEIFDDVQRAIDSLEFQKAIDSEKGLQDQSEMVAETLRSLLSTLNSLDDEIEKLADTDETAFDEFSRSTQQLRQELQGLQSQLNVTDPDVLAQKAEGARRSIQSFRKDVEDVVQISELQRGDPFGKLFDLGPGIPDDFSEGAKNVVADLNGFFAALGRVEPVDALSDQLEAAGSAFEEYGRDLLASDDEISKFNGLIDRQRQALIRLKEEALDPSVNLFDFVERGREAAPEIIKLIDTIFARLEQLDSAVDPELFSTGVSAEELDKLDESIEKTKRLTGEGNKSAQEFADGLRDVGRAADDADNEIEEGSLNPALDRMIGLLRDSQAALGDTEKAMQSVASGADFLDAEIEEIEGAGNLGDFIGADTDGIKITLDEIIAVEEILDRIRRKSEGLGGEIVKISDELVDSEFDQSPILKFLKAEESALEGIVGLRKQLQLFFDIINSGNVDMEFLREMIGRVEEFDRILRLSVKNARNEFSILEEDLDDFTGGIFGDQFVPIPELKEFQKFLNEILSDTNDLANRLENSFSILRQELFAWVGNLETLQRVVREINQVSLFTDDPIGDNSRRATELADALSEVPVMLGRIIEAANKLGLGEVVSNEDAIELGRRLGDAFRLTFAQATGNPELLERAFEATRTATEGSEKELEEWADSADDARRAGDDLGDTLSGSSVDDDFDSVTASAALTQDQLESLIVVIEKASKVLGEAGGSSASLFQEGLRKIGATAEEAFDDIEESVDSLRSSLESLSMDDMAENIAIFAREIEAASIALEDIGGRGLNALRELGQFSIAESLFPDDEVAFIGGRLARIKKDAIDTFDSIGEAAATAFEAVVEVLRANDEDADFESAEFALDVAEETEESLLAAFQILKDISGIDRSGLTAIVDEVNSLVESARSLAEETEAVKEFDEAFNSLIKSISGVETGRLILTTDIIQSLNDELRSTQILADSIEDNFGFDFNFVQMNEAGERIEQLIDDAERLGEVSIDLDGLSDFSSFEMGQGAGPSEASESAAAQARRGMEVIRELREEGERQSNLLSGFAVDFTTAFGDAEVALTKFFSKLQITGKATEEQIDNLAATIASLKVEIGDIGITTGIGSLDEKFGELTRKITDFFSSLSQFEIGDLGINDLIGSLKRLEDAQQTVLVEGLKAGFDLSRPAVDAASRAVEGYMTRLGEVDATIGNLGASTRESFLLEARGRLEAAAGVKELNEAKRAEAGVDITSSIEEQREQIRVINEENDSRERSQRVLRETSGALSNIDAMLAETASAQTSVETSTDASSDALGEWTDEAEQARRAGDDLGDTLSGSSVDDDFDSVSASARTTNDVLGEMTGNIVRTDKQFRIFGNAIEGVQDDLRRGFVLELSDLGLNERIDELEELIEIVKEAQSLGDISITTEDFRERRAGRPTTFDPDVPVRQLEGRASVRRSIGASEETFDEAKQVILNDLLTARGIVLSNLAEAENNEINIQRRLQLAIETGITLRSRSIDVLKEGRIATVEEAQAFEALGMRANSTFRVLERGFRSVFLASGQALDASQLEEFSTFLARIKRTGDDIFEASLKLASTQQRARGQIPDGPLAGGIEAEQIEEATRSINNFDVEILQLANSLDSLDDSEPFKNVAQAILLTIARDRELVDKNGQLVTSFEQLSDILTGNSIDDDFDSVSEATARNRREVDLLIVSDLKLNRVLEAQASVVRNVGAIQRQGVPQGQLFDPDAGGRTGARLGLIGPELSRVADSGLPATNQLREALESLRPAIESALAGEKDLGVSTEALANIFRDLNFVLTGNSTDDDFRRVGDEANNLRGDLGGVFDEVQAGLPLFALLAQAADNLLQRIITLRNQATQGTLVPVTPGDAREIMRAAPLPAELMPSGLSISPILEFSGAIETLDQAIVNLREDMSISDRDVRRLGASFEFADKKLSDFLNGIRSLRQGLVLENTLADLTLGLFSIQSVLDQFRVSIISNFNDGQRGIAEFDEQVRLLQGSLNTLLETVARREGFNIPLAFSIDELLPLEQFEENNRALERLQQIVSTFPQLFALASGEIIDFAAAVDEADRAVEGESLRPDLELLFNVLQRLDTAFASTKVGVLGFSTAANEADQSVINFVLSLQNVFTGLAVLQGLFRGLGDNVTLPDLEDSLVNDALVPISMLAQASADLRRTLGLDQEALAALGDASVISGGKLAEFGQLAEIVGNQNALFRIGLDQLSLTLVLITENMESLRSETALMGNEFIRLVANPALTGGLGKKINSETENLIDILGLLLLRLTEVTGQEALFGFQTIAIVQLVNRLTSSIFQNASAYEALSGQTLKLLSVTKELEAGIERLDEDLTGNTLVKSIIANARAYAEFWKETRRLTTAERELSQATKDLDSQMIQVQDEFVDGTITSDQLIDRVLALTVAQDRLADTATRVRAAGLSVPGEALSSYAESRSLVSDLTNEFNDLQSVDVTRVANDLRAVLIQLREADLLTDDSNIFAFEESQLESVISLLDKVRMGLDLSTAEAQEFVTALGGISVLKSADSGRVTGPALEQAQIRRVEPIGVTPEGLARAKELREETLKLVGAQVFQERELAAVAAQEAAIQERDLQFRRSSLNSADQLLTILEQTSGRPLLSQRTAIELAGFLSGLRQVANQEVGDLGIGQLTLNIVEAKIEAAGLSRNLVEIVSPAAVARFGALGGTARENEGEVRRLVLALGLSESPLSSYISQTIRAAQAQKFSAERTAAVAAALKKTQSSTSSYTAEVKKASEAQNKFTKGVDGSSDSLTGNTLSDSLGIVNRFLGQFRRGTDSASDGLEGLVSTVKTFDGETAEVLKTEKRLVNVLNELGGSAALTRLDLGGFEDADLVRITTELGTFIAAVKDLRALEGGGALAPTSGVEDVTGIKGVNKLIGGLQTVDGEALTTTADLKKFDRQLDMVNASAGGAGDGLEDVGEAAEKAGGNVSGLNSTVQRLVRTLLAGFGFREVLRFFKSTIDSVSLLQESTQKAEVVFGEFARSVKRFAEGAAQSIGLSEAAALEAAGTFGNVFTSFGFTQEAAARLSVGLTQLSGDLASFNNLAGGAEEAAVALRSGLTGEIEPLKRLGAAFNAVEVEAEAVRLGIVDQGEELSEVQKILARYSIILDRTANAQGDFLRTSDQFANQQRQLTAEIENTRVEIGEELLPVATELLVGIRAILPQLADFGLAFTDLGEDILNGLIPTIQAVVVLLGVLGDIFGILPPPIQATVIAFLALKTVLRINFADFFASLRNLILTFTVVRSAVTGTTGALAGLRIGLAATGAALKAFGAANAFLLIATAIATVIPLIGIFRKNTKDSTADVDDLTKALIEDNQQIEKLADNLRGLEKISIDDIEIGLATQETIGEAVIADEKQLQAVADAQAAANAAGLEGVEIFTDLVEASKARADLLAVARVEDEGGDVLAELGLTPQDIEASERAIRGLIEQSFELSGAEFFRDAGAGRAYADQVNLADLSTKELQLTLDAFSSASFTNDLADNGKALIDLGGDTSLFIESSGGLANALKTQGDALDTSTSFIRNQIDAQIEAIIEQNTLNAEMERFARLALDAGISQEVVNDKLAEVAGAEDRLAVTQELIDSIQELTIQSLGLADELERLDEQFKLGSSIASSVIPDIADAFGEVEKAINAARDAQVDFIESQQRPLQRQLRDLQRIRADQEEAFNDAQEAAQEAFEADSERIDALNEAEEERINKINEATEALRSALETSIGDAENFADAFSRAVEKADLDLSDQREELESLRDELTESRDEVEEGFKFTKTRAQFDAVKVEFDELGEKILGVEEELEGLPDEAAASLDDLNFVIRERITNTANFIDNIRKLLARGADDAAKFFLSQGQQSADLLAETTKLNDAQLDEQERFLEDSRATQDQQIDDLTDLVDGLAGVDPVEFMPIEVDDITDQEFVSQFDGAIESLENQIEGFDRQIENLNDNAGDRVADLSISDVFTGFQDIQGDAEDFFDAFNKISDEGFEGTASILAASEEGRKFLLQQFEKDQDGVLRIREDFNREEFRLLEKETRRIFETNNEILMEAERFAEDFAAQGGTAGAKFIADIVDNLSSQPVIDELEKIFGDVDEFLEARLIATGVDVKQQTGIESLGQNIAEAISTGASKQQIADFILIGASNLPRSAPDRGTATAILEEASLDRKLIEEILKLFPGFADGGIFDRPTPALVGEDGREVLLPLTRPQRALQLAKDSGLFSLFRRAQRGGTSSNTAPETFNEKPQPNVRIENLNVIVQVSGSMSDDDARRAGDIAAEAARRRLLEEVFAR